jgi:pyruvate carboxylase
MIWKVLISSSILTRNTFGDKTSAKNLAMATQVPVVIGSDDAFATPAEAEAWINDPANPITYPVIVKAAMGGGGR